MSNPKEIAFYKLNPDTILSFDINDGWCQIRFKEGTLFKWRVKATLSCTGQPPGMTSGLKEIPPALLIGGKPAAEPVAKVA